MGRLTRHRSRKQPKLSRTIPIYGDPDKGGGEDDGVWYRCWHCKQLNNVNKSKLGGPDSTDGVVYVDYAETPDRRGVAVFGGISNSFTAQLNGSDGNPMPVMNAIVASNGGTGCSFCGSLNWRGDY
jgi:hypothetical protein